ncbi:MAG: GDP-mannose 4,6-dehydratase [Gemmatimonadota bacterium]
MKLDGKKVLVTGGAGFIGSHLVEALAARAATVRVLVRYNSLGRSGHLDEMKIPANVECVWGDVADLRSVLTAMDGCQVVFHLAALIGIPYSYHAPQSYLATNLAGTLNVLEAARITNVERLVHTSTSETYGTARYVPIDEQHPLQGQSPYSATKIGADKLAESYHLSFDLPVATLRPFNTYGPRQSARAVIPTIISQALEGDRVMLGSLDPVRDLTFVSDTVAAFLATAETDAAVGKTINAGTGKGISIGELTERILRVMGKGKSCRIVTEAQRVRPPASEVMQLVCDQRLAESLLGWRPRVSLDEGLLRTAEYVAAHRQQYKAHVYNV